MYHNDQEEAGKNRHYAPLDEGECYEFHHNLTDEQIHFIDAVALQLNISFERAFKKVWKDAFRLLMEMRKIKGTYSNLLEDQ